MPQDVLYIEDDIKYLIFLIFVQVQVLESMTSLERMIMIYIGKQKLLTVLQFALKLLIRSSNEEIISLRNVFL